ncbi:unnamed protein product [Sphenostylis stenocarpa]|uniref:Uncharacterized protein n=1 Tax=Sphenostylis stenocarpa TaxID=92480 RepID=A0AA86VTD2_9FABA|nr:unnamed protein product [Sphenostylis stenocarpa]
MVAPPAKGAPAPGGLHWCPRHALSSFQRSMLSSPTLLCKTCSMHNVMWVSDSEETGEISQQDLFDARTSWEWDAELPGSNKFGKEVPKWNEAWTGFKAKGRKPLRESGPRD